MVLSILGRFVLSAVVQKVFPYDLKPSYNTSVTDEQTDGQTHRQTTTTTMPIARPLRSVKN